MTLYDLDPKPLNEIAARIGPLKFLFTERRPDRPPWATKARR